MKVIAVLGVGPGLGLSVARRWAAEGYAVAMASRSPARHEDYLGALPSPGHRAYAADVTDPSALGAVLARIRDDFGRIDAAYFGPAAAGRRGIVPLPEADAEALREPIELLLLPLPTLVAAVQPEMLERGDGTILVPTGLSGRRVLPRLGNLAPASGALRMYALTLAAAVADRGVHVAAITIGGLIAGGDIHRMVSAGDPGLPTLDPDEIAAAVWQTATDRTETELVFDLMPDHA
jgi:NAD(P)-dependent dehydrogenase (short-subunit alcohol dehydrogenase family)